MEYGMTKEAISYLVETGEDLAQAKAKPQVVCVNEKQFLYIPGQELQKMDDVPDPDPRNTTIYTLQGLVDFIKADIDHLLTDPEKKYLVIVQSPTKVVLCTPIRKDAGYRVGIASCEYNGGYDGFNHYMDAESFIVTLQSRFQPTKARDTILSLIGNMTDEQTGQTADDGVTQKITFKKGVTTVDTTKVVNPVPLVPIRTFTEVKQPESPFILRIRPGTNDAPATVALFESDGGAWQIAAVQEIGAWLKEKLADCNVEVIA